VRGCVPPVPPCFVPLNPHGVAQPRAHVWRAEDEDSFEMSVRNCVVDAVVDIVEVFPEEGLQAVASAVMARIAAPTTSWKSHECCMLYAAPAMCMCCSGRSPVLIAVMHSRIVSCSLVRSVVGSVAKMLLALSRAEPGRGRAAAAPALDVTAFVGYLARIMSGASSAGAGGPYLVGRALWCFGKLSEAVPDDVCVSFMSTALSGLQVSCRDCTVERCAPFARSHHH
jgi:hypothetical protein